MIKQKKKRLKSLGNRRKSAAKDKAMIHQIERAQDKVKVLKEVSTLEDDHRG